MAKTRGVFALITRNKTLLLSERADGKGWNLPGGGVKEGETDQAALVREVKEKTGLDVEVLHQVGPNHIFNDDTAVAYACKVFGGEIKATTEAMIHAWVNAQEVKQGWFDNPIFEIEFDKNPTRWERYDVKLVGPEGRLGRTGRMVWDAFSLMEESKQTPPLGFGNQEFIMKCGEELVCRNNCFFQWQAARQCYWPRLDPYSPTGIMEIK